jgi:hypothetical protein
MPSHIDDDLTADPATDSVVVAQIRRKVIEGKALPRDFAEGIGKTERCIQSWIADGLPVDRIGRTVYVVIDPALEWIRRRSERKRQEAPRPPGRPGKSAASAAYTLTPTNNPHRRRCRPSPRPNATEAGHAVR